MNYRIAFALALAVLVLTPPKAAALEKYFEAPPPVRASDYAVYEKPGIGALYGAVAISNDAVYGPGITVYLLPDTDYTRWWIGMHMQRTAWYAAFASIDQKSPPIDPVVMKAVRRTFVDAHGQFAFVGLPPGKYFAFAAVEDRPPPRMIREGYREIYTVYNWSEGSNAYVPHTVDNYIPPTFETGRDYEYFIESGPLRVISGVTTLKVNMSTFYWVNCGLMHRDVCPGADQSSNP